jgi:hypothetical protein
MLVRGYGNEALQTTYGSTLWSVRLKLDGYRSRTDTVETTLSLIAGSLRQLYSGSSSNLRTEPANRVVQK